MACNFYERAPATIGARHHEVTGEDATGADDRPITSSDEPAGELEDPLHHVPDPVVAGLMERVGVIAKHRRPVVDGRDLDSYVVAHAPRLTRTATSEATEFRGRLVCSSGVP